MGRTVFVRVPGDHRSSYGIGKKKEEADRRCLPTRGPARVVESVGARRTTTREDERFDEEQEACDS